MREPFLLVKTCRNDTGPALFVQRRDTVSVQLRRARRRNNPQFDQSGRRDLRDDDNQLDQDRFDIPRALRGQHLRGGFLPNVEDSGMSDCCPPVPGKGLITGRIVLNSIITCPHCHAARMERMPIDACMSPMNVPGVAAVCARSLATVASSVPMLRCRVRPCKPRVTAAESL